MQMVDTGSWGELSLVAPHHCRDDCVAVVFAVSYESPREFSLAKLQLTSALFFFFFLLPPLAALTPPSASLDL